MAQAGTGLRDLFRTLRPRTLPTVQHLRDRQGTTCSDPKGLDRALDEAWGPIFQGIPDQVGSAA
eukprot:10810649-Alexandrium_andersonii.AAC.1